MGTNPGSYARKGLCPALVAVAFHARRVLTLWCLKHRSTAEWLIVGPHKLPYHGQPVIQPEPQRLAPLHHPRLLSRDQRGLKAMRCMEWVKEVFRLFPLRTVLSRIPQRSAHTGTSSLLRAISRRTAEVVRSIVRSDDHVDLLMTRHVTLLHINKTRRVLEAT